MAPSRHKAIVAGLALTLTLGTAAAPAAATLSNESPTTDTDPNGMGQPLPGGYNKADFYQGTEGVATFARSRSASNLTPVALSAEMKYFAEFESHSNYDQGLSPYDGYNALGYYQLDRRYALGGFMQQVYDYDSVTYSMFAGPLAKRSVWANEGWDPYDYTTRQLKAEAQELDAAWHAAYNANPAEFAALQDGYMYNNYYLPAQSTLLNTYGVDIRNRADCVKGLVWGMTNMFGQGGVEDYFRDAKLSNSMTDRELVTALCDTVVERVVHYCSSQPEYWEGWQNRYRAEKEICLGYITEDEAQAEANKPQPEPEPAPQPKPPVAELPQMPSNPGADGPGAGDPLPSDPVPGVTPDGERKPDSDEPGGGSSTQGGSQASGGVVTQGQQAQTPSNPDNGSNGPAGGGAQGTGGSTAPNASPNRGEGDGGPQNKLPDGSTGGSTDGSATQDNGASKQPGEGEGSSSNGSTQQDGSSDVDSKKEGQDDTKQGEGSKEGSKKTGGSSNDGNAGNASGKGAGSGNSRTGGESGARSVDGSGSGEGGGDGAVDDAGGNSGTSDAKTKDALPQTGDIAALVMTGAAGLAAAGGSFISLGKLDGKRRDEDL